MKSAFLIFAACYLSFGVFGVLVSSKNIQNILEEDRRGAASEDSFNKEIPEKSTRGAYGGSESKKHQKFFYPSVYGSEPSAPGHGGGYGGSTGFSSSGYNPGITGYGSGSGHTDYGIGYSGNHGQTYGVPYGGGYGGSGYGVQVGGHGGGHHGHHGALALKGLLIPLAGIALLGAAAALSTNPVLLQLGVVNGRRKRSLIHQDQVFPANPYVKPDTK